MDYYQKYLKYKTKYLELKKQLGLGSDKCSQCSCTSYVATNRPNNMTCINCKHSKH